MEPKRIGIWIGVVIVTLYCVWSLGALSGEHSKKPSPFGPVGASATPAAALTVQVAGQVVHPGVYVLPANSRVQDALQQAGGLTANADTGALNLAGWLQDGAKIEVPPKTVGLAPASEGLPNAPLPVPPVSSSPAAPAFPAPPPTNVPVQVGIASPVPPSPLSPGASPAVGVPPAPAVGSNAVVEDFLRQNPVNLNTATAGQLELLPEIGPKMAARILEYRAANGPFRSTQGLRNVKGIGDKTMAAIAPFIYVR